jgi:hypothetical protein
MTPLVLDINLVNPTLHERYFNYPGKSGLLEFHHITQWSDYLLTLQIRSNKVPTIHTETYHAALRMMLLAWVDASLIKPSELQTLCSLESALVGAYLQPVFEREQDKYKKVRGKHDLTLDKFKHDLDKLAAHGDLEPAFRDKLQALFESTLCAPPVRDKFQPGLDKLLDYMAAHDKLNDNLDHAHAFHNESKKADRSALSIIRNGLAHGHIFNAMPWCGLFEAVHDVMEHAYRKFPERLAFPVPTSIPTQEAPTHAPITGLL